MKRFVFVVGLVVLVFAVSLWAQTTAPKPDPELKKFDVLLGHWTYVIEYKAGPLGPASKASGEVTINKILGGFFIQTQGTEKGPKGESRDMEIIGYDATNKSVFSTDYHDDGSLQSGTYASNGNIFTYTGKMTVEGKPVMFKYVVTVAADMLSGAEKGEISMDGNTWLPLSEAKFTKIMPAPKTK